MTDRYLTLKEMCDYLRVSDATIRNWKANRGLPVMKAGGVWRGLKKDLDAWMKDQDKNDKKKQARKK